MKKNFRYWWWLWSAFFKKQKNIIIFASLLSFLLVALVNRVQPVFNLNKFNTTRYGLVGRFRIEELPAEISGKISYGLTKIEPDGWVSPALAENWDVTDEGKTYRFRIKDGAKWHDQKEVKTSDILIRIENVETEIIDDKTIVFHLKESYSPFPTLLSKPLYKNGYSGLGDWTIKTIKFNGEFIEKLLIENDEGEKKEYRFYPTSTNLMTAIKLGEVDQANELTGVTNIPDWANIRIEPVFHFDRYLAIYFNTEDAFLGEKSFRQALAYAIPNKPKGDLRALSPISPLSWAYNPQVKPYDTDVTLAEELLESIFQESDRPKLELTTTVPYLQPAEEIAKAWSKIGIETNVKVITAVNTDFQVLLIGQKRPPDPDQYTLWHSTQPSNITHFSSPKIDKLLEDGRKTSDKNERTEIYRDFQRFLLEESPAIFLEHITTYTVSGK